ncbi:MAG: ArsR family transcriptional regulator, partial [Methanospirillum sp.]|nr:ArsR family transcriptional regulator [Methanospirillum sp.]
MTSERGRPGSTDDEISLFSTKERVMAIDSQVKKKILQLLGEKEILFDEIVELCGKAKSTISVHVRDLENAGLISSRPDPADNRRKILSLTSDPIGKLSNTDRNAPPRTSPGNGVLPFTPGDIASFFRWGVLTFRIQAMAVGINIDPVLERTGWEMGTVLSPLVQDPDLSVMVGKMHDFWETYGLGSIALSGENPILLTVTGCFECEDLPVTGHGACSFDIG